MNKCRFISEGYVFLASIDEISKSKRPRIAYFLEESRYWFHGYQIHNFWEQPAVLYCSDNSLTNSTKDKEEPFSNLKIELEDLEWNIGDRVNYNFSWFILCWWLFWLFWRPYWLWFRYNNVKEIMIIGFYEMNICKKLHVTSTYSLIIDQIESFSKQ